MPLRNKRTIVNFERVRLAVGVSDTDFRQMMEVAVRTARDEAAPFRRLEVALEDWPEVSEQLAVAIAAGNAVKV